MNTRQVYNFQPILMEKRRTLTYVKPSNSSFIISDQKLLEKHYNVIPFLVRQRGKKGTFFLDLFSLAFFLLRNEGKSEAFICWFGDYHAAVMVMAARILNLKSIIIAGGQEAICYKELGKGVYVKRFRGWCVKYALRNATLILPNHASLIYHENHFYNTDHPHIDGIRHYVKNIKGEIIVVPNGIDFSRIDRNAEIKKVPNLVLTVGSMNKKADFYNKGFDLFIELARMHQDKEFALIGIKKSYLGWIEENFKVSEIKNLEIILTFCPDEILTEYFNKATVYLQVSITEGMPVSLGEAMLCECIPLGSNVNGIPDAIGDTGVLVYRRNIDELSQALQKALTLHTGANARKRIIEYFSIQQREHRLLAALSINI
jgi:glycosyltransferase involved in cell wall biosynthesis